jgi:hypothetical protein
MMGGPQHQRHSVNHGPICEAGESAEPVGATRFPRPALS